MFSQALLPALFSVFSIPLVSGSPISSYHSKTDASPYTPAVVELSPPSPATSKTFSVLPNTCFSPEATISSHIGLSLIDAPICSEVQTAVLLLYDTRLCQGRPMVRHAKQKAKYSLLEDEEWSLMFRCVDDVHAAVKEESYALKEFDIEWVGRMEDGEKVVIDGLGIGQDDIEEEKEQMRVGELKEDEDDEDEDDDEDKDEDKEEDKDEDKDEDSNPPTRRPQNQGNPFVVLGLILLVSLLILVLTVIKCVMQGKKLINRAMKLYDAFQSRRTEGQIVLEG
ncbi:hypothetical protein ACMFMG_000144 [Clarireedia jacksonii]